MGLAKAIEEKKKKRMGIEAYLLYLVRRLGIFGYLNGCHLLLGRLLGLDGGRHLDDDIFGMEEDKSFFMALKVQKDSPLFFFVLFLARL